MKKSWTPKGYSRKTKLSQVQLPIAFMRRGKTTEKPNKKALVDAIERILQSYKLSDLTWGFKSIQNSYPVNRRTYSSPIKKTDTQIVDRRVSIISVNSECNVFSQKGINLSMEFLSHYALHKIDRILLLKLHHQYLNSLWKLKNYTEKNKIYTFKASCMEKALRKVIFKQFVKELKKKQISYDIYVEKPQSLPVKSGLIHGTILVSSLRKLVYSSLLDLFQIFKLRKYKLVSKKKLGALLIKKALINTQYNHRKYLFNIYKTKQMQNRDERKLKAKHLDSRGEYFLLKFVCLLDSKYKRTLCEHLLKMICFTNMVDIVSSRRTKRAIRLNTRNSFSGFFKARNLIN